MDPSTALWHEGKESDPVTPDNPLVGLETQVLRVWLENSPSLRRAYGQPHEKKDIEQAVRLAVDSAHAEELQLRAQGLHQHEAEELTRAAMWTPPPAPRSAHQRHETNAPIDHATEVATGFLRPTSKDSGLVLADPAMDHPDTLTRLQRRKRPEHRQWFVRLRLIAGYGTLFMAIGFVRHDLEGWWQTLGILPIALQAILLLAFLAES